MGFNERFNLRGNLYLKYLLGVSKGERRERKVGMRNNL